MLEWAAYLKHLQSILLEYDSIGAFGKPTMLRYFQEDLRPFILAELQNEDLELKSFVQILKKVVVPKIKANLQPRITASDMDQQCPWGSQPANTTAAKANS